MIGTVKMLVVVMQFPPRLFDSISVVVVPKYSSLSLQPTVGTQIKIG